MKALALPDLSRFLNSAFAGPAWHGPSVRASVRGVLPDEAQWKPGPGRNSIWELALHIAYAKHRVRGRLESSPSTRFARRLARPWWPEIYSSLADGDGWTRDRVLLDASHGRLITALEAIPAGRLDESRKGKWFTLRDEVAGLALHDVYHAGQILLIRRLYASKG